MTKHSDPRSGDTTYRLTNVVQAEPARSLFEVPADYTLKDSAIRRQSPMQRLTAPSGRARPRWTSPHRGRRVHGRSPFGLPSQAVLSAFISELGAPPPSAAALAPLAPPSRSDSLLGVRSVCLHLLPSCSCLLPSHSQLLVCRVTLGSSYGPAQARRRARLGQAPPAHGGDGEPRQSAPEAASRRPRAALLRACRTRIASPPSRCSSSATAASRWRR